MKMRNAKLCLKGATVTRPCSRLQPKIVRTSVIVGKTRLLPLLDLLRAQERISEQASTDPWPAE